MCIGVISSLCLRGGLWSEVPLPSISVIYGIKYGSVLKQISTHVLDYSHPPSPPLPTPPPPLTDTPAIHSLSSQPLPTCPP